MLYVLSQQVPSAMPPEVCVRYFQRHDAEAFRQLNEHWISKFFTLEEPDRIMLADPLGKIVSPGGAIFVACAGAEVIGTCALTPEHDGGFELVKMAVSEDWQGRGIGRKLLLFAIQEAKELGIKRLRLETSHKLGSAIHLYESVGFKHVPAHPSPFVRADVFMEIEL
ncbi:GCN5-related N-acetyltransferase [Candidatus Koribacter versatilis Ellin345]|uniref:GCN5-related N-acetyltransferase n=1 Tax=Koribacter versatilis (strain Ellin345) TaxID=204669 RepID=Q1IHL4_KORVE|nr:GNAT family N-acetyltransferase [Candidatus Koribacter versatilis]ABF43636.1 GCN5-related N-acetyltransferase [Candidatus Koribacter versatilis Ellin345]